MSDIVEIRKAKSGDEYNLINMFKLLYHESDFLLMEPKEDQISVEKQGQLINEYSHSNSQVLFIATDEKVIVGFLGGTGGKMNRNRHSIHFAMGVLASHQRKGIGSQLLHAFIDWSASNHFHRIELTVIATNIKAKALYEKMGFQTEGLKRHSLKVNSSYVNEHCMAKLI